MNTEVKLAFLLLLGSLITLASCKQNKFSPDQKAILTLYASQYLSQENQQLYARSEKKKRLLSILDPPITAVDFKLPKIALLPGTKIQAPDTLFSENELKNWGQQISSYKQIRWDQTLFPDFVTFIQEEQIPDYRKRTAIPPPSYEPICIHYITPPLIYNGKSAIMYSKTSKGAGSIRTHYVYFVKNDTGWQLKDKRLLVPIY